jgi:hypothetical protein
LKTGNSQNNSNSHNNSNNTVCGDIHIHTPISMDVSESEPQDSILKVVVDQTNMTISSNVKILSTWFFMKEV